MRRSWSSILLAALIIQIPFELRHELLGLSNLQWTFVGLLLVSAPSLVQNWKIIFRQRAVQAAMLFIIIQWLTAVLAPDFKTNAIKAGIRFTAGDPPPHAASATRVTEAAADRRNTRRLVTG